MFPCPNCGHTERWVKDSRMGEQGAALRRRSTCRKCGQRFTTYERPEMDRRDYYRGVFRLSQRRRALGLDSVSAGNSASSPNSGGFLLHGY